MSRQSIIFNCVNCGEHNATMYPIKSDVTPGQLGQKNRNDQPLSYISNRMDMWVGFRRCKKCKTWLVVVFCGWSFEIDAFTMHPTVDVEKQGTISLEVAQWVIKQARLKGIKVPRSLKLGEVSYIVTWKGCSEGHYEKHTATIKEFPPEIEVTDDLEKLAYDLEEFMSEPLSENSERHNWLVKNIPDFVFKFECGTNPTNFHVINIKKVET